MKSALLRYQDGIQSAFAEEANDTATINIAHIKILKVCVEVAGTDNLAIPGYVYTDIEEYLRNIPHINATVSMLGVDKKTASVMATRSAAGSSAVDSESWSSTEQGIDASALVGFYCEQNISLFKNKVSSYRDSIGILQLWLEWYVGQVSKELLVINQIEDRDGRTVHREKQEVEAAVTAIVHIHVITSKLLVQLNETYTSCCVSSSSSSSTNINIGTRA